jgi:hypothetical protein
MKIKKKVDKSTFAPAPKYNIVGCLLEDANKAKPVYTSVDDVFGANAIIEVERICRMSPSREVAIASIKQFLSSRVADPNIDYVAAVLEASFRNKFEAERMEHELSSES